MRKTIYIIRYCVAAALTLAATSCVKDELHDTPHPDYGKITVTADWSDRGGGGDIPAEWTVTMGDYTGTETGETHSPDYLFKPGGYTLAAYNIPEGITISGTTATVAAADGGCIVNTPGWLFSSVQEVAIEADTDYELTAVMHQQVRKLTLMIEPTGDAAERIESIEGTLSGAAGTLDFATGTHGTPSEVGLRFTKITDGDDAGKWMATVRLLGIAKTAPLTLGGTIAETPGEAGFTGEITDWETVDGGGVDAEM